MTGLRQDLEKALTERFAAHALSDMCFHSRFTEGCLGCFTREAMWAVEPIVSAALEAARADERAKTLAMAAACAECFSDEAADDLWERAGRAGWKVP